MSEPTKPAGNGPGGKVVGTDQHCYVVEMDANNRRTRIRHLGGARRVSSYGLGVCKYMFDLLAVGDTQDQAEKAAAVSEITHPRPATPGSTFVSKNVVVRTGDGSIEWYTHAIVTDWREDESGNITAREISVFKNVNDAVLASATQVCADINDGKDIQDPPIDLSPYGKIPE